MNRSALPDADPPAPPNAATRTVERLRVFLASPGDVPEERAYVRHFLHTEVLKDPFLKHIAFEVVSWDDPAHGTLMSADRTPQQAVRRFHGDPATCAIVVVILATRLGTHLDIETFSRPDGSRYLSGTEWEYENAFDADPRPEILVYRRKGAPSVAADDPQRDEKHRQWDNVVAFFRRFDNSDGSARGGYWPYDTPADFKTKFAADIRSWVAERLATTGAPQPVSVPAPTQPSAPAPTPVLPPPRCLGRNAAIADLTAALAAPHPAVLVLGGPGIGKTTLTRAVAASDALTARFAERRWFVPLETATDAATLRTAVVLALGGNPADPAAFDHALARLGQAPGLLLLDNLETPWEADRPAVQDTLSQLTAVPGLALLASLRGGTAPASPAWSLVTELPPLAPDDARALFLGIARKIRPDDPDLAPFLAELGGVPLAIELVGRRAEPLDRLTGLWRDWQRRGTELARDPDLPEERRTSVLRSVDLSLHSTRLHEEGRRLLALLGLSPAGMAREDREALLDDDATEAERQLLAIGLAVAADGRLDLLPPVRDAVRRLAPAEQAAVDRWCCHYLRLVAKLGVLIGRPGGAESVVRLKPEVANLEASLAAALK